MSVQFFCWTVSTHSTLKHTMNHVLLTYGYFDAGEKHK